MDNKSRTSRLNINYLLIVASSARMLAQAARKAGFLPLVIDLFADCDTCSAAEAVWQINSLAHTQLLPALENVCHHYAVRHAIYGSGLESHPDSLYALQQHFTVLGNSLETFVRLHDKATFFATLDRHGILHPDVRFSAPIADNNWLVKPIHGHGGVGIQRHTPNKNTPYSTAIYWQKYQTGSQHSILFLADGQQLQIIGFNSQWTASLNNAQEFLFSGISNHCPLSSAQKNQLGSWLQQLVYQFDLKGLNSLDFIQTPTGESLILEINPRPPASMQLYNADLLSKHIASCTALFKPCEKAFSQVGYTGYQIVYAEQDLRIPKDTVWQSYCCDLPPAGALIRAGQPICSIIVHQNNPQAVHYALHTHSIHLLKGLYSHASQC